MRIKLLGVALAAAFYLSGVQGSAQSAEFFPLSAVRPGMTGVGKTIFHGTEIESFQVEILGVLEKIGPQQNLILARLSGQQVERFGVFAGMSGSPVFIDDKLVGAVAYAFSFATEPIAGITPIREMVDVFEQKVGTSFKLAQRTGGTHPVSLYEIADRLPASRFSIRDYFLDATQRLPEFRGFGALRPIMTPVNISGFESLAVHNFMQDFQNLGMLPVLGNVASANDLWEDLPLQPGSTLSIQLVRGDLEISASGTVTYISGDRVYAFGHPFMSTGFTNMPMSQAAVLGVIPSLMNSQKLSATTRPIGALTQDRATGIMGIKGKEPKLVPVKLTLKTSRGEERRFNYEVVNDSFLTPFLMTFAVYNSITSSERSLGGQTIALKCRIALHGQPAVTFENSISDVASSSAIAAVNAAAPVAFLLSSGFEDVNVEEIEVQMSSVEETRGAFLDKIWQNKLEARPGEEVELTVFLRRENGETSSETYPIRIPEGIPPGELKIMVGDGLTLAREDSEAETAEFIPQDLGQLVRAINNLKKNDRFYVRLYREQKGAVIGGQGLPGLPPSILALYSSDKTSGDTIPINRVVFVEHELPATDYVLTGQKTIRINIKG